MRCHICTCMCSPLNPWHVLTWQTSFASPIRRNWATPPPNRVPPYGTQATASTSRKASTGLPRQLSVPAVGVSHSPTWRSQGLEQTARPAILAATKRSRGSPTASEHPRVLAVSARRRLLLDSAAPACAVHRAVAPHRLPACPTASSYLANTGVGGAAAPTRSLTQRSVGCAVL